MNKKSIPNHSPRRPVACPRDPDKVITETGSRGQAAGRRGKERAVTSMLCSLLITLSCWPIFGKAENVPLSLFPLNNYSQDVDHWFPPTNSDYKTPLVSANYQQQRLQDFYRHTFSTAKDALSPWSKSFIQQLLNDNQRLLTTQKQLVEDFNNKDKSADKINYGENFRPYSEDWIRKITDNMDLQQFATPIKFTTQQRAILVKNTYARMLPTREPAFNHFTIAGQGYPFDNLQASALWVGAPVYIIGQTKDGVWSLVATSSFEAWVETAALAKVNSTFVRRWNKRAQKLAAIMQTETPVIDMRNGRYRFSAYVGSVFPVLSEHATFYKIIIPLKDVNGHAYIREAKVSKSYARIMPVPATRENFASLFKTLKNQPYGWGGYYFYNDCSQEMQSLFTPFGIWLPRNSAAQTLAGSVVDKTSDSQENRLAYLMENGHPLMTAVFIGGHIFLYLGNYPNPSAKDNASMAMTYQNIWGLSPKDRSYRAVIGQAIFLPLLLSYPENPELSSLANKKYFKVIYLDKMPSLPERIVEVFSGAPSS